MIGYDNRRLNNEDFNNDAKDAGEIGAGHTVTALYEIVPVGSELARPAVDPLKYSNGITEKKEVINGSYSDEMLTVKLRYKSPQGGPSSLLSFPLKNASREFSQASRDIRFASAVAGAGLLLKNSENKGDLTFSKVIEWAESVNSDDKEKIEFINLIKKAKSLK